jgi:putative Holliday junction resolvase
MPAGPPRAVLAFDYGARRIGVAAGNTLTGTAEPLAAIENGAAGPDWNAIARCFESWRPAVVVVGVPYNMDGTRGRLTPAAQAFADEIGGRFGAEVVTVDERLSSREAEETLRERRRSGTLRRKVRRADVDSEAARVLLRQWLGGTAR